MKEKPRDEIDMEREYEAVEAGDGEFVVYDRSNKTAWVQSNYTVDVRQ